METLTTEYSEKEPPGSPASPHAPVGAQLQTLQLSEDLHSGQRSRLWADVTTEQWSDWRWQMVHRLRTLEDFQAVLNLSGAEVDGITIACKKFAVAVTPYFASLMDREDANCPIRRQAAVFRPCSPPRMATCG